MFSKATALALSTLITLTTAHFRINYPPDRGEPGVNEGDSPCGSLNTPSSKRTLWPLTGGRIQITAEHDEAYTEIFLGLGDNPTTFSILLKPTFDQIGMGVFCLDEVAVPDGTHGVADGVNATIQILQKAPEAGESVLYDCADITFSSNPPGPQGTCKNGTGVTAKPLTSPIQLNGTGSGSNTTSTTGGSNSKSNTAAADRRKAAAGSVIGAAVLVIAFLM